MAESNKMGTRPLLPLIVSMSLPPLISMFMQYTYNFVDCMFVSWISEDALTAVSLAFPLTTLMVSLSIWLGVGVNVLIAACLGRQEQDRANRIVSHGLLLSTVCGVAITIVAELILEPFFAFFAEDPAIYDLAIRYMRVCAFMQVPNMVHICIQKIVQGTGNMVAPMAFQIAGVVFNFIFDPILIFGYFGFPALGIEGAAVSTICGYTLSMVLAFYVLIFRRQRVRIQVRGFRLEWGIFRSILSIGFPSFVMNALGALMTYFTNLFLVAYSTTAVAFFGAYFKLQQVVIMTLNGLVQGCVPIMSYNFGARYYNRLRQCLRYGTVISLILTGASVVILWAFPRQILKIFAASPEMMSFGVPALKIMCTSYLCAALTTMIASHLQATRRIRESILLNLMRQLLILLPCMWILSEAIGMSGVWWSFPAAELITAAVSVVLLKRRG